MAREEFNLSIIFLSISIIINSCTKIEYIPFHFDANIPYGSKSKIFKVKMFSNKIVYKELNLGMIVAVNANNEKFVVISKVNTSFKYKNLNFDYFDLKYSSLIKYNKLEKLIEIIKASVDNWDKEQKKGEGLFFQYYNFPEQNVTSLSKNVVNIERSFLYEYQNTEKGNTVSIYLGEKLPFFKTTEEKENITSLLEVLVESKKCLDHLDSKEYIDNLKI